VAAGLLFTPLGHTNFLSAMQAVQNLGVVLLAAAAVHLAARPGAIATAAALSLAAVATHTSANGLLLPITLAVVWAALGRWRAVALAGAAALLLAGIYFHGYVWPTGDFAISRVPANAAVMLGAFAGNSWTGTTLVVLVGGAMFIAGGVVALRPSWWRSRPAAGGILVFLLLSVLMAAKGRSDVGSEYMMQDRYLLYGLLTAAVLLGFTREALPTGWGRLAGATAVFGAVGFAVHAYSSVLPRLATESRWVAASAINRQLGGDFLLASGPVWEDFRRGLTAAEQAGAFAMPPLIGPEGLRRIDSFALAPAPDADFTVVPSAANLGAELRAPAAAGFEPAPFVLAVREGIRLVLPLDRRRASWRSIATTGRIWDESFAYVWPSETYRAGTHALHGFELAPGGGVRILWSARVDCPPL
jgi:hypothetical protein